MAFGRDDARRFPRRLPITVDRDHARAFARVKRRRRLAIAPSRPRRTRAENEGDAVLEAPRHRSGDLARELLQHRPGLVAKLALPFVEEARLAKLLAERLLVD